MNRSGQLSPLAVASLILSSLGALTFGLLAIPGLICGLIARSECTHLGDPNAGLARAGVIVGAAVLILYTAVGFLVYVVLPVVLFSDVGGLIGWLAHYPQVAVSVVGLPILLLLLPSVFRSMARRREGRHLRTVVEANQCRS